MTTYVIPCCGEKATTEAPARDFYLGSMFRHTLTAAEAAAQPGDTILVLSAWYGLVPLTRTLRPYEQRMDQPGRIDTTGIQASFLANVEDLSGLVVGFLPRVYMDALADALHELCIHPVEAYEATRGIGEQRHVNTVVTTHP